MRKFYTARILTASVLLTLLFILRPVQAQVSTCDSNVPNFLVDLTDDANGLWQSPPVRRDGLCCANFWPDRCVEFFITLHPSAIGIIFDIELGAEPPGALFYRIGCGDEIPVGDLACLDGPGPHVLTFCKPGANLNIYSIQSIPGRVVPDTATVVEGCSVDLSVSGFIPSTVTWTDITSGNGAYNQLLSCDTQCDSTIFSAADNLPDFVSYRVCGILENPICEQDTSACDTVVVRILRDLEVQLFTDSILLCTGENNLTLTSALSGSYNDPQYQWFFDDGGGPVWLGTDSFTIATNSGTYGVIAFDTDYPICRRDTAVVSVQFAPEPFLLTPDDRSVCEQELVSLSASGMETINWYTAEDTLCLDCPSIDHSFTADEWVFVQGFNASGCSLLDSFQIRLNPNYSFEVRDTICSGTPYTLPGGSVVFTGGTYFDSLTTLDGCDSVYITELTALPSSILTQYDTICQGELYTFPNGTTSAVSGTSIDTFYTGFGCDSVIHTLLTVLPVYEDSQTVFICSGEVFLLPDGILTDSSGTYSDTLSSQWGCDSIIHTVVNVQSTYSLSIRDTICSFEQYTLPDGTTVNTPGTYVSPFSTIAGCDSVITATLTVMPSVIVVLYDTICAGETYIFPGGVEAEQPGEHIDTFYTGFGCDSVIRTVLTVLPRYETFLTDSLCEGDTYLLPGGTAVDSSGTYVDSFVTVSGCDSIITTSLTFHPNYLSEIRDTICNGEPYLLPDGSTASGSGYYSIVFNSTQGCDSIIDVYLTVLETFQTMLSDTICNVESYTLPDGTETSNAGIYVTSLSASTGCDSVVTIDLAVLASVITTVYDTICAGESYILPDGSSITTGGTQIDTFLTGFGCDSVIHTYLTVLPNYTDTVETGICEGDSHTLPSGTIVQNAGTYTDTLSAQSGCDSVITSIVVVYPNYQRVQYDTICDVSTFILPGGTEVSQTGVYTDSLPTYFGCDSVIITYLEVMASIETIIRDTICEGETYILPDGSALTVPGEDIDTFYTGFGCDSVVHTYLTVLPTYSDTSYFTICEGDSVRIHDGSFQTGAGTYSTTYASVSGCDSTITSTVEVLPAYLIVEYSAICAGEAYVLPSGDTTYFSGIYEDSLTTVAGCDSVVITALFGNTSYFIADTVQLCAGEGLQLPGGEIVFNSGIYIDSLFTYVGCDSVYRINVDFQPFFETFQTVTLCGGESFELPDGSVVADSGIYIQTLVSTAGCDSVITTDLRISPAYHLTQSPVICAGETYQLPDGSFADAAGTFVFNAQTLFGCDSVIITDLTILPAYDLQITANICEGESYDLPDGTSATTPGVYTFSGATTAGCDSSVTVSLTTSSSFLYSQYVPLCAGASYVLPGGDEVYSSGVFVDSFQTAGGCDSLIETTVSFASSDTANIVYEICTGDTIALFDNVSGWSDTTLLQVVPGALGCDSFVVHEVRAAPKSDTRLSIAACGDEPVNIGNETYYESGTYTQQFSNQYGCDSLVVVNLTISDAYFLSVDTVVCPGTTVELAGMSFDEPGFYIVEYLTRAGCDSVYYVDVGHHDIPSIDAREDTTIRQGGEVRAYLKEYTGSENLLEWWVDGDLYATGIRSFTQVYFEPAIVTVRVLDEHNCGVEDVFRIELEEDCPEDLIFAPNIITPNGDQANDVFKILNPAGVIIQEVAIFNRWGEMVYQAPDFEQPWDGSFRGADCQPGVYVYYIRGTCSSGSTLLKKGNITLIK